ncbi:glycosyltransferase family 4 protein [Pararhodonellum marinum]|uniref:glycosyltransferase family 4 protein n=1 Tax=Pararhodonellum marinum TaxID=2755358 RepID=UPI00188E7F0A|nr:glycosyltransferase [Pararhodonellum marinum]
MKIIINTAHQRFGGAVQVALSFINECKEISGIEFHVWVGPGVGKSLNQNDFPSNFFFYEFDFGPIGFKNISSIQGQLEKLEKKIQPDVIMVTSGPSYFHSHAPQIIGFNLPLYIYPESPFVKRMSLIRRAKLWLKRKIHFRFFKRDAVAYVVQTEDVNQRVKKALNTDKVYTVTNTCSSFFLHPKPFSRKLPPKKEFEFRLLTVSAYYPHKDLEIIPFVLKELQKRGFQNFQFVLTLKDEDFERHIGSQNGIINVGPIPPEECPSLYQECDIMFLPTLAECFSASYPEAMAMGKPIITTDLGFARSICGDAACYYKPQDYKSAANKIIDLAENKEFWNLLVENGKIQLSKFDTPNERALKYIEICKSYVKT